MAEATHFMTRLTAEFQLAMANPNIPEEEKARLAAEFQVACEEMPSPRWASNPGPQAAAYVSEADHLFFGGSTGGGKSGLLLGLGLTAHLKSLILRLEGTNLTEMKDQLQSQMVTGDRWKNIGHGGEFRTYDGRLIEMLGCDDEKRAASLQGRPHDLLAFDELPQFPEIVFRRLCAWLRTNVRGQRTRVVGAGNPPLKAEEEWVIRYWAPWLDSQHPAFPANFGELRYYARIDGEEVEVPDGSPITTRYKGKPQIIHPKSRTFIPATLDDNPDLNTPEYRASLALLPEPMRSQLLYGDMQIGRPDHEWQLIPTSWVVRSMKQDWKPDGGKGRRMSSAALDCSQGGDDDSCLARRYDNWIAPLITWPGKSIHDGKTLANNVVMHLENLHMPILVDVLATAGGSTVEAFRILYPKLAVWAINFGTASLFKDRTGRLEMANLRAEAFFRVREALDPNMGPPETRLQLPNDPLLMAELCSIRWRPSSGRVRVEEKSEIKKRIGRSTDRADAVAMSLLSDRPPDGGWLPRIEGGKSPPWNPGNFHYGRGGFMGGQ